MTFQPGTYAMLTADLLSVQEVRVMTAPFEAKEARIRPVVITAKPAFNAATQKVVQAGWAINGAEVNPVWNVIALTAEEIAEAADHAQVVLILATAQAMIDGTGTAAERNRRVELALGRTLKRLAKNGTLP